MGEGNPYRELTLDRFQESLSEVSNTGHLPGSTVRNVSGNPKRQILKKKKITEYPRKNL